jgi:hypothetical protein
MTAESQETANLDRKLGVQGIESKLIKLRQHVEDRVVRWMSQFPV